MSLASTRATLEAALAPYLGSYRDTSLNPPATVGPALWVGANIPESYRVDTLEAVLMFSNFERDDPESEDAGVQGIATYRVTLIQHGEGLTVEDALYAVLAAFPNATPEPVVTESDLTLESVGVRIPERINRP